MDYEFIEHTADVGVKAYGKTLEETFENAAKAMFDVMTDISKVKPVGEYIVRVKAGSLENLLVDWLQELLFIHETQNVVLCEFDVKIADFSLEARARGEAFDKRKHELKDEVKAVTYHMLEINEKEGYIKVLFDI